MRNSFLLLAVVASLLLSTAGYSEEKATGLPNDYSQFKEYESPMVKDQCLIVAKNCVGADDTVLKRVDRLNNEISKGTAVYTHEELESLQEQLNWIYYESDSFPAVRL